MKNLGHSLLCIVVFITFCTLAPVQGWADSPCDSQVTLQISAEKTSFVIGAPSNVGITWVNCSNAEITVRVENSRSPVSNYEFLLLDSQGKSVEMTEYHKMNKNIHASTGAKFSLRRSYQFIKMPAKGQMVSSIDLSTLFIINKPGTYKLELIWRNIVTGQDVHSNALYVTYE